jgi:nicotinate phosphoribosyltransferase
MTFVSEANAVLLTDLYELTMVQAYVEEGLFEPAVFSLFSRRLPAGRNYLLACGLEDVLGFAERLCFPTAQLDAVAGLGMFSERFLRFLERLRFTGDIHAVPEGTPVFANEPLLEVVAPLPEAQLLETFAINQVHFQTVAASKAARVVAAAGGRRVVDFGLRRMHGADAGLKAARAFHVAGVDATSNVLATRVYGVPAAGTMAHSYVQAHATEIEAFRAFVRTYPEATLLVDTYDTLEGVRNVTRLARELGPAFRVRAVRLDSGDLLSLSREARRLLDEAGQSQVEIFASGGLDEHAIARLVEAEAPISGFGVGTAMGVSDDAPALDMAYKLVEYAGRGRIKLSQGKALLPGRKQVFRREQGGRAERDVIGRFDEALEGRPLLRPVMVAGRRLPAGRVSLADSRATARRELAMLPPELLGLAAARPPYAVELSAGLVAARDEVARSLALAAATAADDRRDAIERQR